jgi:hypothetical protein
MDTGNKVFIQFNEKSFRLGSRNFFQGGPAPVKKFHHSIFFLDNLKAQKKNPKKPKKQKQNKKTKK